MVSPSTFVIDTNMRIIEISSLSSEEEITRVVVVDGQGRKYRLVECIPTEEDEKIDPKGLVEVEAQLKKMEEFSDKEEKKGMGKGPLGEG